MIARASKQPRTRSASVGVGESKREPLTRAKLEQMALGYLNRFDVSSQKLTQHLRGRLRKLGAGPEVVEWLTELVARYQASGLLDDARFAKNLAAQLARRGKSARAISQKLAVRGVANELAGELMATRRRDEPEAELEAARAYVRKRRLGPFRPPEERQQLRHKDLASLARQGFSFDIARQALGSSDSSEDEL